MAGNSWWRATGNNRDNRSPSASSFQFPSGSQPTPPADTPAAASPALGGSNVSSTYGAPSRQASKKSRAPSAEVNPAGTSTKPMRILRRPKQEDPAASSIETSQASRLAQGQLQRDANLQSSPALEGSPQGQGGNRKARRANMQWQSPPSMPQVRCTLCTLCM